MCLLQRLRANLSLFLITITLLTMISSVFGQPTYTYYCSVNYNNDTANLRTLLGSLSSKAADNNTFYNDTSNNMYGLYFQLTCAIYVWRLQFKISNNYVNLIIGQSYGTMSACYDTLMLTSLELQK
ncbi:hypothetical protein CsSME_00030732 [Camellia sinensis var. sinensis]